MSDQLFERAVNDWLEDGSDRTPPRAIDGVLLAVKTTRQERDLRIPWRMPRMPAMTRATGIAAVALVAVVGAGGLIYLNSKGPSGVGGGPTAAPTTAPTTAPTVAPTVAPTTVPTPSGIPTFTSRLYGYTVNRPAHWSITPASVQWPSGGLINATNGQWFDVYMSSDWEGPNLGWVGVAAQPIPAGMTAEEWMLAYAERQAASGYVCSGPVKDWVDAVVGTLAIRRIDHTCDGKLPDGEDATGLNATEVVFVIDGTGYVMNANAEGISTLLGSFQPGASQ